MGSEPPSVPQSDSELDFFDLALDLMVIAGFAGYFKRVNPAYERTLGYPLRELLSRPFLEFIHPEDLPWVRDKFGELVGGDSDDVIGFEHRVISGDGSVRWLQWSSQTMRERGVIFAVGRDVTDRRRADAELREAQRMVEASRDELARLAEEQAALRRVATLVARGASPEELFTAVVVEVGRVFAVENVSLARYESGGMITIVAISERLADSFPVGGRWPLGGKNVTTVVFETGRSARIDSYGDASGRLGIAMREQPVSSAVGATAYFVVAEALTNVAKHAHAGRAEVTARIEHGRLAVQLQDDGVGGARPDGSGLLGLADRLAAVDGKLRVDSPADSGTLGAAAIPLPD